MFYQSDRTTFSQQNAWEQLKIEAVCLNQAFAISISSSAGQALP